MSESSMLTFVHLSDIHFRKGASGTMFDKDDELRNEIQRDIERVLEKPATGILVTGDIAFAGKTDEFKIAQDWLKHICDVARCDASAVWTVPGNHDIDREVIEQSVTIQGLHAKLRSSEPHLLDNVLATMISDPVQFEAMMSPLTAYNNFAVRYKCNIRTDKLYWDDDLRLNDGSILRIRGLNSALISDRNDSESSARLLLSSAQTRIARSDGVEHMILCHHPPDWLIDHNNAEDMMSLARVSLFGHKHRFRIHRFDESIVLSAGATHPDRIEPSWDPRYNIINISVKNSINGRILVVQVFARVWDNWRHLFKPDVDENCEDMMQFELHLPEWLRPSVHTSAAVHATGNLSDNDHAEVMTVDADSDIRAREERNLTYRFISLPFIRQIQLALSLGLLDENEHFSEDPELWTAVFTRARDMGRIPLLSGIIASHFREPQYLQ